MGNNDVVDQLQFVMPLCDTIGVLHWKTVRL